MVDTLRKQEQTQPVKTEQSAPAEVQAGATENNVVSVEDILKRSVTAEASVKPSSSESNASELADLKSVKLDDIKDPQARAFVERRVKELESGVNRKFEELAEKRRELEARLAEANPTWTPQRIKTLLQDQNFLSSVQELQRTSAPQEWEGSQEEWSSLSPREKQEFDNLRRQNMDMSRKFDQLLQSQEAQKQDEQLKQKFPDYDPEEVNKLQKGLMDGTIQATRADLWKVATFEKAIERAYRLGLQDKNQGLKEKINAGSNFNEMNVNSSNEVPEEIKKMGITEILKYRLSQTKKQQ
jgi:hypothetical protein